MTAPSSLPLPLSPAQLDLLARVNRAQVHGLPHLAAALLALYHRTYGPLPRAASAMILTPEDLQAIDALFARRLQARVEAPLPHKLSVAQFAWCIERSAYYVAEQTRLNRALRPHVQGRRPKKIHPAALALYGVDSGLAAARLRLFPGPSTGQSADKAPLRAA